VVTNPYQTGDVICQQVCTFNKNTPTFCNKCGDPVADATQVRRKRVQERGMTYPRRSSHDSFDHLRQGSRTALKTIRDIKEQEFLRRYPADDGERHVHHQRTERVIVSQLHRSPAVFSRAQQPQLFPREDYSVPRSWVNSNTTPRTSLRSNRPKRKSWARFSCRAGHEVERRHPAHLLSGGTHFAARKDLYWKFRRASWSASWPTKSATRNPMTDCRRTAHHRKSFQELIKAKFPRCAPRLSTSRRLQRPPTCQPPDRRSFAEANKPDAELWQAFAKAAYRIDVLPRADDIGVVLSRTLDKDADRSSKEALSKSTASLRPGDPPTLETARIFSAACSRSAQVRFSASGR